MMKKILAVTASVIIIIACVVLFNVFASNKGYAPANGFVPDEETALKIAEAVWLPIYGDEIYLNKPFIVEFDSTNNCWKVTGSLPADTLGGVPEIIINKSDGKIMFVYHGK